MRTTQRVELSMTLRGLVKKYQIQTRMHRNDIATAAGVDHFLFRGFEKGRIELSKGQLIRLFLVCNIMVEKEMRKWFFSQVRIAFQSESVSIVLINKKRNPKHRRRVCVRKTPFCLLRLHR